MRKGFDVIKDKVIFEKKRRAELKFETDNL